MSVDLRLHLVEGGRSVDNGDAAVLDELHVTRERRRRDAVGVGIAGVDHVVDDDRPATTCLGGGEDAPELVVGRRAEHVDRVEVEGIEAGAEVRRRCAIAQALEHRLRGGHHSGIRRAFGRDELGGGLACERGQVRLATVQLGRDRRLVLGCQVRMRDRVAANGAALGDPGSDVGCRHVVGIMDGTRDLAGDDILHRVPAEALHDLLADK